ncbi:AI-2E family transporter [Methylocapsa sp. D3K7]|uniref:AI-2E family transporter n=1 Tax=Methylocapsa sp. D3K7 TaxID=3041435 RepID=UPI00244E9E30|nr:AI-2E family transporter [Methylocapsa sp. D3K7]WGJ13966.1 AI-2E family transporter [Methylocapsa sp. D3K7]
MRKGCRQRGHGMKALRPSTLWIGMLAVLVLLIVLLHDILLPFVAGLALAYLLEPVVEWLERHGINRTLATLGIVGIFIIGVATIVVLVTPVLGAAIANFIDKLPDYIAQMQAFANDPRRPWLRKLLGEGLADAEQSAGQIAALAADWIPTFLRRLWSDSAAVLSMVSLLVVTPIVTVYLLIDWRHLIAAINRAIPTEERPMVLELAGELDDTIAGFLRGQGTICLILAVYYAVALWAIGLNHGVLIGLAAGLISFVPYLGSLSGLLLSVCVAVLQFWPHWTMIPVVVGIFLAGQAIADYLLSPYLIASRVQLNPVSMMFAITAFGYLFGFVGLLIAVPLAAAIGVTIRFAMRQHLVNLTEAANTPPPVSISTKSEAQLPRKNWLKALLSK